MSNCPLPDREYLLRAFRKIRLWYWELDLDDVLNNPIRSVAVIAVARRMQREPTQPPEDKSRQLRPINRLPHLPKTRGLDFKRLASGEREDD